MDCEEDGNVGRGLAPAANGIGHQVGGVKPPSYNSRELNPYPHPPSPIPHSLSIPDETILGSLTRYLTTPNPNFQPMNSNFGLLPPLNIRDKALRHKALSERSLEVLKRWICCRVVRGTEVF
ncbi:MAG: hypothetical protein FWD58_05285 [Firmicutes bacterium]|nr:hypothetical protein [Bacillota bacterium]